jgi:hypothetical protein
VVLAAVASGLINELHGGWPWWIAAAAVTLVSAALAGWLAFRTGADGPLVVEAGGVYAGQDLAGRVKTKPEPSSGSVPVDRSGVWCWLGTGAVAAGRDITQSAEIDTSGDAGPGAKHTGTS